MPTIGMQDPCCAGCADAVSVTSVLKAVKVQGAASKAKELQAMGIADVATLLRVKPAELKPMCRALSIKGFRYIALLRELAKYRPKPQETCVRLS